MCCIFNSNPGRDCSIWGNGPGVLGPDEFRSTHITCALVSVSFNMFVSSNVAAQIVLRNLEPNDTRPRKDLTSFAYVGVSVSRTVLILLSRGMRP